MSLPVVPAGANPFTVYLDSLETQLYFQPAPQSFKPRMMVLMAICLYGAFASGVYGLVMALQQRVKSADERRRYRWVGSRVDGYICLNLHSTVWALGVVSCLCMFVYSLGEYYVFELKVGLGFVNTYRSFVWIAIVLQGFLVSAASFQSFLIVASRAGQRVPSPTTANWTFIVTLVLISAAMVGTDTVLAMGWQSVWRAVVSLRAQLERDAAQWTPQSSDALELLGLLEQYSILSTKLDTCHRQQVAMLVTLIVGCFLVALANVGSSLLLLAIRRQINQTRESLAALGSPLNHSAGVNFNITTVMVSLPLRGPQDTEDATMLELSSPRHRRTPSSESWMSPALGGEGKVMTWDEGKKEDTDKWWAAKARRKSSVATVSAPETEGLKGLRRAERELIVCATSVFFFSISYAGEVLWDLVMLSRETSWYSTELSYFFVSWTFAIAFSVGCSTLAALAARDLLHMRNQRRARPSIECVSPGVRSLRASVVQHVSLGPGLGVMGV